MTEEKFSLKDYLFNHNKISYLASLVEAAYPKFQKRKFINDVMQDLEKLELKARITLITEVLSKYLPTDYKKSCIIITNSLPKELDQNKSDNDFGDFIFAPFSQFISTHGKDKKHLNLSYQMLHAITRRFSAEFEIREFINLYPEETFKKFEQWSKDSNYHVRRLVSEASRPSLPWAQKISWHYSKALPLLDILHADKNRFVTRSVANHLNDISKLDPNLTISTLKKWLKLKQQSTKELDYIVKHSLRTLIKQGNSSALNLLGYKTNPKIELSAIKISPAKPELGNSFEFTFEINAKEKSKILVDYLLFVPGRNTQIRKKIYKLKSIEVKKNEEVVIAKKHRLLKSASTYKLYPGEYCLALQVNGKILQDKKFIVV